MIYLFMCIIYLLVALAGILVTCFTEPNRAGIILNPLSPDKDMWFHFLMFSENYLKIKDQCIYILEDSLAKERKGSPIKPYAGCLQT